MTPSSDPVGSRWNNGRALRIGVRVMVRRHLCEGETSHLLTDVLGTVEATEPQLVVRTKDGRTVEIPVADIAVLKVLPARPVLVRDVRTLSHAVALGWPGTEYEIVDGWLCRAGDDWSYRRGAAVPVQPWAVDAELDGVRAWYRDRGLEAWLELPTRLVAADQLLIGGARLGAAAGAKLRERGTGELEVRTAEIATVLSRTATTTSGSTAPHPPSGARRVDFSAAPSAEFLHAYHATAPLPAARVLPALQASDHAANPQAETAFAHLMYDGKLAAFARGTVSAAPHGPLTLGISCVETTAAFRRQGLAREVVGALAQWAQQRGATLAQLHVFVRNSAGLALWDELGFDPHHRTIHVPLP